MPVARQQTEGVAASDPAHHMFGRRTPQSSQERAVRQGHYWSEDRDPGKDMSMPSRSSLARERKHLFLVAILLVALAIRFVHFLL
jgi:hypothetical protein